MGIMPRQVALDTHSSSNSRIGFRHLTAEFKRCHRLVAGDGREIVEEFVERVAGLQIVIERFDRHPRADDTGVPPNTSRSL